ncbi:MAG: hypothetical protein B1H05_01150 [Candidatus Cloacimonas sp. 4484_140]|nr:MAG: hypothetical protein B1H05_01150 [Candidatus Cloacimonas sp. 4484_140]HHI87849.1 hypothetical protein [Candidatus Cloacimonadota bacterium]
MKKISLIFVIAFLLFACSSVQNVQKPEEPVQPEEVIVQYITLKGEISEPKAEISGLAWYGDYLILLPQYPHLFPSDYDGSFFAIPKSKIAEYLNEVPNAPIKPIPISLNAPGLKDIIEGYEGFESIAFYGNTVFFTVESSPAEMMGYLFKGTISDDMKTITVEVDTRVELPPRAPISNATDETILVTNDRVITIYEINSEQLETEPYAYVFDHSLNLVDSLSLPYIEYRLTDATELDENSNFWMINYFWPGDQKDQKFSLDPIARKYGEGETHSHYNTVERLLEFHYSPEGITLNKKAPIQLKLIDDKNSRNWEGIVRYGDRGFLIVSDKYPQTYLGFVRK